MFAVEGGFESMESLVPSLKVRTATAPCTSRPTPTWKLIRVEHTVVGIGCPMRGSGCRCPRPCSAGRRKPRTGQITVSADPVTTIKEIKETSGNGLVFFGGDNLSIIEEVSYRLHGRPRAGVEIAQSLDPLWYDRRQFCELDYAALDRSPARSCNETSTAG